MRLSHRDFERFVRALRDVYTLRPVHTFFRATTGVLRRVIPSDQCTWFVYDLSDRPRLDTVVEDEPRITPTIAARVEEVLLTHPFAGTWLQGGPRSALTSTDFARSVRDAHRSSAEDVYRHLELNYELAVPVKFTSRRAIGVTLVRKANGFTERDRTLLTMFQPHLNQAYSNAELIEPSSAHHGTAEVLAGRYELTGRESQIGYWIIQGKTNWEIAYILGIGERTVEKHVERLLRKLHVDNRTSAATFLLRQHRSVAAGSATDPGRS